jgi:hypothetical protein
MSLVTNMNLIPAYTESETEQLYQLIKSDTEATIAQDVILLISKIRDNTCSTDRSIYHLVIKGESADWLKEHELYGEGKLFMVSYESKFYSFSFHVRHLKRILTIPLDRMPLLINTRFVCLFAKWRLSIAK